MLAQLNDRDLPIKLIVIVCLVAPDRLDYSILGGKLENVDSVGGVFHSYLSDEITLVYVMLNAVSLMHTEEV